MSHEHIYHARQTTVRQKLAATLFSSWVLSNSDKIDVRTENGAQVSLQSLQNHSFDLRDGFTQKLLTSHSQQVVFRHDLHLKTTQWQSDVTTSTKLYLYRTS